MEDYNLWADLLDTFQSSADWIKALWLVIPPAFVLALVGLIRRRAGRASDGELLFTVCREPDGLIQIHRYGLPDDADPQLLKRAMSIGPPRGPEVVAATIAMLASEDGIHINGEEIRVDGGTLA